jgi:transposase
MPGKWKTPEDRIQVATLLKEGFKIKEIQNRFPGFKKTLLYKMRKQIQNGSSLADTIPPPPKGRHAILDTPKRSRFFDAVTNSPTKARMPIRDLGYLDLLSKQVSKRTIQRWIKKHNFLRARARAKPFLTPKHKALRLKWALEHQNWTEDAWNQVIWTDESSFQLKANGLVYVTRPIGREYGFQPRYLMPRYRGYSDLMIYGAINGQTGKKTLVFLPKGKVNSDVYCSKALTALAQLNDLADEPICQHDNARPHDCAATRVVIDEMDLVFIKWPANSPDLNPIENLWFILKDRVRRHRPKSLDELKYYIQLEWDKITEEDIKKLVKTMQKRIRAVIANNGGHCKY